MKIKTDELLNKLEILKNGIDEKDFSSVAKYLYFKDGKIMSYNGRFVFSVEFENDLGDFILHFTEFYKLVKRLKQKTFRFVLRDNTIMIQAGKINIELSTGNMDELAFPSFEYKNEFKNLPDDFLKGIKVVQFCTANESSPKGYVHIIDSQIFATDGFRIAKYKIGEMDDILLPYDSLPILLKLEVKEYLEEESFYIFKNESIQMYIMKNTFEALDFNQYSSIWESKSDIKILLPGEIKDSIDIAEVLTDQNDLLNKKVEFILKDKKIVCKSTNEIGVVESIVECDNELTLSFFIHPIFLSEVLSICENMEVVEDIVLFRTEQFCYFFRIEKGE